MKKIGFGLLTFVLCFFCFGMKVNAGSSSISASSKNVTIGGSVTIKVSANGLAGKFSVVSSNSSVLSGGTGSVWLENSGSSYKFTAKKVGSATITLNAVDVSDLSTNSKYSSNKSVTIKVSKPREKSTNNDLKSLSIEGKEISPAFDKNTLEYKVDLTAETEKIKINATKADNYSSVTGAGEVEVAEGENKFSIVVTSETGVSKIYTLIANVVDNNPINVEAHGEKLTVVKRNSLLTKPELFTESTVKINDLEIPAFINEKNSITLVGLRDSKSEVALYTYDSKDNTYSKYLNIVNGKINFMYIPTEENVEGYLRYSMEIDGKTYDGYKISKNSKYILLYGMNLETGEKGWYSYHSTDKTIQLYDSVGIERLNKDHEKEINIYRIIIISLGVVSLGLLISLIVVARKHKKNNLTVKKMNVKTKRTENVE